MQPHIFLDLYTAHPPQPTPPPLGYHRDDEKVEVVAYRRHKGRRLARGDVFLSHRQSHGSSTHGYTKET